MNSYNLLPKETPAIEKANLRLLHGPLSVQNLPSSIYIQLTVHSVKFDLVRKLVAYMYLSIYGTASINLLLNEIYYARLGHY